MQPSIEIVLSKSLRLVLGHVHFVRIHRLGESWTVDEQSEEEGKPMGKFVDDTSLEEIGNHRWKACLQKGWRIGRVPNGGYVLAIVGRAISQSLSGADPLSINAFYLEPTTLGEAEIHVEILRLGKGTQFATARMYQEGSLKVIANAAYTDLDKLKGPTNTVMTMPDVPPFDAVDVPAHNVLEIHSTIDTRIVKGREFFDSQEPTGTGEFIAYMQHVDGAPIGVIDLLMFGDMMPPPSFTLVPNVGWVPTVEMTVQLRGAPAPGPILCHARSHTLMRGVTEQDCEIWDSNGDLVAVGRQTMKVRSIS